MGALTLRRSRGFALIVVLMLLALMTILATEVLYRQDRFRARTENLTDWDRRYQYAIAAEAVAIQALIDDLDHDRERAIMVDDCVDDRWAVRVPPTPYEGAVLAATVQDLQGRFNLNSLVTGQGTEFLRDELARERLAQLLSTSLSNPAKAQRLSHEMADWLDSNNMVDGVEGAEDADYRWRRTPNVPVLHESELRALLSMSAEDIPDDRFWNLYSALPIGAKLNINTAPLPVLDAYFATTVGNAGTELIERLRTEAAIQSLDDLFNQAPFVALEEELKNQLREALDVRSSYFQVVVEIEYNGQRSRLVSRLMRVNEGDTAVYSRQLVPILGPMPPPCNDFYNQDMLQQANNKE
ncbi:type II secretion system minor pseudopilin GspK [Isoalcanivorax beigongshangi]|uniref:Type II secretion system protein K n=1 Tax=Isoalcanivorax beigongshangi TaxID=3238810 RepID=A0ABV4AHL6_9GAMM